MVRTCISLRVSGVERHLTCLFTTWKFLCKNVYSGALSVFKLGCSVVVVVVVELYEFFIYSGYSLLITYVICKGLFPFCRLPFILLAVSSDVQKLLSVTWSCLFIFTALSLVFESNP